MNPAADRTDLRVAVPEAIEWVVAAVLVGYPAAAWLVVTGAAVVVAGGFVVLRWLRASEVVRAVAAAVFTALSSSA